MLLQKCYYCRNSFSTYYQGGWGVKVIENSQRDNIAFVSRLAKIFNLMDIDTHAVWGLVLNGIFGFEPGLVGGHCMRLILII
jgi:UDP-N-acetyl-D-mannosaminuronate dehydrogenase